MSVKKVANILSLDCQDLIEAVLFLMLLFLLVLITRHVQRYLIKRRFKKECENVFTEDFYARLDDVLKNEFKEVSNVFLRSN